MSPEAQRIAIAEACGWSVVDDGLTGRKPGTSDCYYHKFGNEPVPDYLNDLNAMHEAEKILTEKQCTWYMQRLFQVRIKQGECGTIGCMADRLMFATASQRAEAFLRTIGKWKEEQK